MQLLFKKVRRVFTNTANKFHLSKVKVKAHNQVRGKKSTHNV